MLTYEQHCDVGAGEECKIESIPPSREQICGAKFHGESLHKEPSWDGPDRECTFGLRSSGITDLEWNITGTGDLASVVDNTGLRWKLDKVELADAFNDELGYHCRIFYTGSPERQGRE